MKYQRVYNEFYNGKQLKGYQAENGAFIECEYASGGCGLLTKPSGYFVVNDRNEKIWVESLREAKQVVETGKSDFDLF